MPQPAGTITDVHDADITAETIIPPWYGERLDLDHAIYVCLANAKNQQEQQDRRDRRDQQEPEPFRPCMQAMEPGDWAAGIKRIAQYYDQHPDAWPQPQTSSHQVSA